MASVYQYNIAAEIIAILCCIDFVLSKMCPWSTKAVVSRWGIFFSNSQQYTVWVKIIDFSFMPKIIRILSKYTVYIYIYYISYCKYIKTSFLISNMHMQRLALREFDVHVFVLVMYF